MLAFVQSYSQSQARLMFVTTLGMDNFDCTKMNAHFNLILLSNSRLCSTHKHSSASFLLCHSINEILRILVQAQPSTRSTGPRSHTRLGIRSQDLGLPDEYSLGPCGLSAASRHKLAFTRRLYALLTATDTTALY